MLFNIATILNNKESYVRFAFDRFNNESWSIEHIHAQQDKGLQSHDAKLIWLEDAKKQINFLLEFEEHKELLQNITEIQEQRKIEDEEFQLVQNDNFELFGDVNSDLDTIDNLALLSSNINSSLSNNIFPIKRNILISKDKEGEFLPICTKNVFLKFYSSNINHNYFWSNEDRQGYLSEMKSVLNQFINTNND